MMTGLSRSTWLERLTNGSALATILVALVGQAVFSVIFQIRNNEQQTADIELNRVAIATLRSEIVNLQTPLSTLVIRMDGRLTSLETEHRSLEARLTASDNNLATRLDVLDRGGTRALELATGLLRQDLKRLDDQQLRIIQTLEKISK